MFCCAAGYGELPTVPVAKGGSEAALDPSAAIWKSAEPVSLSLQRTPPAYPTDAPATLDIAVVKLQLVRGSGAIFARIEWSDATRDSTELPKSERTWQTEANVKQSGATDRFADACAIMTPELPVSDGVNPSLQMGDAAHPVRIYFWDATRGPAVMRGSGRETKRRTGESFPVRSAWAVRKWTVTSRSFSGGNRAGEQDVLSELWPEARFPRGARSSPDATRVSGLARSLYRGR